MILRERAQDTVRLMGWFDKVGQRSRIPLILLAALGYLAPDSAVRAQLPPHEDWRTLETQNFRITYPEELADFARRAGDRAESAWTALAARFLDPPKGKVDLVLTDHTDVSNGFTRVFPSLSITVVVT